MPSCFSCVPKKTFPTPKALWLHLQKEHRLSALSVFQCGEPGCHRKFSNGKAFMRHVKSHVDLTSDSNAVSIVSDVPVVSIQNECDNCDMYGLSDPCDETVLSVTDGSFQKALKDQCDAFVCKYYSKASLPRNIVQSIIDNVEDFLCNGIFMNSLKDKVMHALQSSGSDQSVVGEISGMFDAVQDPFCHLKTEYKRKQYFQKSGYYVEPQQFQLGKRLEQIKTKQGMKWKWASVKAVHCPITPVLKIFLELPDSLQCILDYLKQLEDQKDVLSNFVQGELWKEKRKNFQPSDIVLPLFVYFDDFQANNVIGPHILKLGGVYVMIGCLPPEIASKLENIFLSILFCSPDRDEFKARNIIKPLLEELVILEKVGIEVTVPSGQTLRVFFVLGLVLGDNLGIHQLCGFVCGFAWSNFPCRFCKVPQQRMQFDMVLDESLLRNKQNYENDVAIDDQTKTGITEKCIFNDLDSFHITENFEGDLLHDFDEGISQYVLTFVLSKLTAESRQVKPTVPLATLNRRMQLFDFGTHSALYKTRLGIIRSDLEKGKLKMTGSEMEWFTRSLGVLIGDLVPEDNIYWKLYLALLNVLDIVRAKTFPVTSFESLSYYLKVLAELFLEHEGNHLMFKFHKVLWHYCSIIKQSGPVPYLSTRKFESKHRQLKLGLYSNMSRVNACLSAAVKHQLGLCHRFIAKKSVISETELGSGSILSPVTFPEYHRFYDKLVDLFSDLSNIFLPSYIEYKGTRYDSFSTVAITVDETFGWPVFGEIRIIFYSDKKVAVLCEKLETVGYCEHFHAFEVRRTREKVCLDLESLIEFSPLNTLRGPKGNGLYVVLRHQL